jgi:hypothetical protein
VAIISLYQPAASETTVGALEDEQKQEKNAPRISLTQVTHILE